MGDKQTMKTIRKSVYRSRLESQLAKYERRIQKMAESAYKIRQMIEQINVKENPIALHIDQREGEIGTGTPDSNAGQSDVSDTAAIEAVLVEQPAELSGNLGDPGINSGSAV